MLNCSVEWLSSTLFKSRVGIVEFIKDCSGKVLMISTLSLQQNEFEYNYYNNYYRIRLKNTMYCEINLTKVHLLTVGA